MDAMLNKSRGEEVSQRQVHKEKSIGEVSEDEWLVEIELLEDELSILQS